MLPCQLPELLKLLVFAPSFPTHTRSAAAANGGSATINASKLTALRVSIGIGRASERTAKEWFFMALLCVGAPRWGPPENNPFPPEINDPAEKVTNRDWVGTNRARVRRRAKVRQALPDRSRR